MKTLKLIRTMAMAMMCIMFVACDGEHDNIDSITPPTETTENNGSSEDDNNENSGSDNRQECRYCEGSGDCPGDHCDGGSCSECGGTGYEYSNGYKFDCPWCDRGKCPSCKGRDRCPKCSGKGYTE